VQRILARAFGTSIGRENTVSEARYKRVEAGGERDGFALTRGAGCGCGLRRVLLEFRERFSELVVCLLRLAPHARRKAASSTLCCSERTVLTTFRLHP